MSRQQLSSPDPILTSSSARESPIDQRGDLSERPSTSSRYRRSEGSEWYPPWLPKRPLHPPPTSTFQSHIGLHGDITPGEHFVGGRKPTPRSVRIVNLGDASNAEKDPHTRRETTDQTRVGSAFHPRVWSRATAAGMLSPTFFSSGSPFAIPLPAPKFHSPGLHLQLLRSPSILSRLAYYLLPLAVFAHIPVQTFFDFNAVFILLEVAKFPGSEAPGIPGSGRNWALGAAAYVACWFTWIFIVLVLYEIIYSFFRRWRVKRPLILPIYLSSPAFNLVAMTSYTNFCFMFRIRYSAFFGESGSLRDYLAETFWFYSQNLPTVAVLVPRAGLSLALLLSFSSPQPGTIALAEEGTSIRDSTYFRDDGSLTDYARGVLIANATWTAWRFLVLVASWVGLWVLSGHGCAGICGPRFRWEEEATEKALPVYDDAGSDTDALPWNWKESTRARVQELYDFCLTVKPPKKRDVSDASELLGPTPASVAQFDGMEQVLAAIGFPSSPPPARRGVLSEDLFAGPQIEASVPGPSRSMRRSLEEQPIAGPSVPLMAMSYSFTGNGAQVSSQDRVPFPPSPESNGHAVETEAYEEEEDGPSSGHASRSMSSLGQPISSRYPSNFGRQQRVNSPSTGAPSHGSRNTRSTPSRISQSTGNGESTDSRSPRASPMSQSGAIPMPPRHPQQGRSRTRSRTVPSPVRVSPTSIAFPHAGRTESTVADTTFSGAESYPYSMDIGDDEDAGDEGDEMMEQPEPEGPHEALEREDVVGLLSHSAAASPRPSLRNLRQRTSNLSSHRRGHGSRSGSNSRSNSQTGSPSSRSRTGSMSAVRSRAQSLVQSIGVASRSSLEAVQAMRIRANSSMARLEEDLAYPSDGNTHSASGSENHTFGHPLRAQWRTEEPVEEARSQSDLSAVAYTMPSEGISEQTVPDAVPGEFQDLGHV